MPFPIPTRFPAELGVPVPASPTRPGSQALGAIGLVLRPGVLFPTRNKRASSGPGRGVAAGSGPTPAHPRGPADAETRPMSSPSRAPPLALPSGLGVGVPAPLSSAPAPTHQWPTQAPRTARLPPAPSLRQPSGKLSNSRWSPQLRSPWLQPERGSGLAPADTYRLLARSGPEPPRCVAASQRSTVETQVELHDWGAAGGASRGADRGAERPAAARTKRRRSGLRCSSPPGQPPGAAVSPQDRP